MPHKSLPTSTKLHTFLKKARRFGYDAEKPSMKRSNRPGTDLLKYPRRGNPRTSKWYWEDEWVGSNPYSGATTVWYQRRPCWQNHYWGYVIPSEDKKEIYAFLRWARRQTWERKQNKVSGLIPRFRGLIYSVNEQIETKPFEYKRKYENIKRGRILICEVYEMKGVVN